MFKENKEALDSLIEGVTGGFGDDSSLKNNLDKDTSEFLLADLESKVIEIL
jgi:hypothetical protein